MHSMSATRPNTIKNATPRNSLPVRVDLIQTGRTWHGTLFSVSYIEINARAATSLYFIIVWGVQVNTQAGSLQHFHNIVTAAPEIECKDTDSVESHCKLRFK